MPGQRFGGGAEEDGEQRSRVAAGLLHGGLAGLRQDGADVVLGRVRLAACAATSGVSGTAACDAAWAAARTVR